MKFIRQWKLHEYQKLWRWKSLRLISVSPPIGCTEIQIKNLSLDYITKISILTGNFARDFESNSWIFACKIVYFYRNSGLLSQIRLWLLPQIQTKTNFPKAFILCWHKRERQQQKKLFVYMFIKMLRDIAKLNVLECFAWIDSIWNSTRKRKLHGTKFAYRLSRLFLKWRQEWEKKGHKLGMKELETASECKCK